MEEELYRAIEDNDTNTALRLLEHPTVGGWINNYDTSIWHHTFTSETCLYLACRLGCKEVVRKILLIPTVDIHKGSSNSSTPLHAATNTNHLDIVKLLIESGSECRRDNCNTTPLHIAAEKDYTQILQLLLNNFNESINTKCSGLYSRYIPLPLLRLVYVSMYNKTVETITQGSTPLHEASIKGNLNSVMLLVEYGADTTLKTGEGETAYDLAVKKGHNNVASYLNNVRKDHSGCNPELITRVANLEIEGKSQSKQLKEVQSQHQQLKEVQSQCKQLKEVQSQCKQLKEVQSQCKQLKEVQSQCKQLKEVQSQCTARVAHLENEHKKVQSQCNQLKSENDDLKSRMSKMEKQLNQNKIKHGDEGTSPTDCIRQNFKYLIENMLASDHLDYLYQEKALKNTGNVDPITGEEEHGLGGGVL